MMANEKRLIDANEVERKLRIAISSWWRDCNSNAPVIAMAMEDALQRVIYAPTVDAVEVVRCKDCKNWGGVVYGFRCKHWSDPLGGVTYFTRENDYCSNGERRTDV